MAFLLAALLAAFACVYSLQQAVKLEQDIDGAGAYVTDFLRGIDRDDVTKMYSFANENRTVQETALQRYLFGDGSKEAYKTYKENYKAAHESDSLSRQRETILKNSAGESGNGSPAAIFFYLPQNLITLRKIAEHDDHFITNGTLFSDGSSLWLESNDNGEYEYEIYYYNSDDFYAVAGDPTEQYTTLIPDVTNPQTVNGSDYDYQSRNPIPDKITLQLRAGEIAVELCRTRYENGNNTYDGYYALSVNERTLANRSGAVKTNYVESFSSYEDFQSAYADAKRRGDAYKNMLFAVVDNDTGKAVSNVAELDGKKVTEDDLRPFTKSAWNYQLYLLTANWSGSQAALDDISGNGFLGQSMTWFLQSGELNGTLYVTFDQTLAKTDAFSEHQAEYSLVRTLLKHTLIVDSLCLLGILVCTVYLIIRAGRRANDCVRGNRRYSDDLPDGCRRRDDEVRMMGADRIFTLLRTVLNLGAAVGVGGIAYCILEYFWDAGAGAMLLMYLGVGLCAAAIAALLLDWLLYLTRHIKNGTLLSNFFIVWLWKKGRALLQKIKAARTARPKPVRDLLNDILRRVLLMGFVPNFVLGLLIVIVTANQSFGASIFLILVIFLYDVFLAGYICFYAYHLRTVIAAVHSMRAGNMDVEIDTAKMPTAVKAFADDVMELRRGLQAAIDNALRDERTKTELITNVSHDLKTPLTSIINYVDLLGRCDIEDETAKEYLAVLSDKSERLKKLIEDLVEASKASAGAVKVELTTVSLSELSAQLLGEYADEFAARDLTVVEKGSEDPILVRADGKLSYRVLDNLFGNVKKYAMPGTRVYLTLARENGRGVLTLRNISEQELDISVDELRERFVRGDRSRSTEGSGLGLSIAEDLCRLQGAELNLSVNGDLFTASVSFPCE